MPAAVGAGTFWTEGTAVVNGDKTVAEATADIDASWPAG
jgi:alpha-glucoside transport system substrate-binding protein